MRLLEIKNWYVACIGFGVSKWFKGIEMLHSTDCSLIDVSWEPPHCLLSIHTLQNDMVSIATVLMYKS